MNIFKKLFSKTVKKTKKSDDSRYNDSKDKKKSRWAKPSAPGEPWSDNSVDTAITMNLSKD